MLACACVCVFTLKQDGSVLELQPNMFFRRKSWFIHRLMSSGLQMFSLYCLTAEASKSFKGWSEFQSASVQLPCLWGDIFWRAETGRFKVAKQKRKKELPDATVTSVICRHCFKTELQFKTGTLVWQALAGSKCPSSIRQFWTNKCETQGFRGIKIWELSCCSQRGYSNANSFQMRLKRAGSPLRSTSALYLTKETDGL